MSSNNNNASTWSALLRVNARRLEDAWLALWLAPAPRAAYTLVRVAVALTSLAHLVSLWPLRDIMLQPGAAGDAAAGMIEHAALGGPLAAVALFRFVTTSSACTAVLLTFALAHLALIAGVLARPAAIALAYWHASLYYALSPAASGYDHVLRLAAFVLVVSPLGAPLFRRRGGTSVDALAETSPVYGLRLLQWQTFLIYVVTVWLKSPDVYWRNGEFLAYFMVSLYSRLPDVAWAHLGALSVVLTYGTLATELSVPLLLWQRVAWRRRLGMLLGLGLHASIALSSNLWLFSLTMLMLYPAYMTREDLALVQRAWQRWRRGA